MAINPIQPTSTDFLSVINDLNQDNDLKTKPSWFKTVIAAMVDVLSKLITAVFNLAFLSTAYTKKSVGTHLKDLDYSIRQKTTSFGTQRFNALPSATFPLLLTKDKLSAITSGVSLRFESREDTYFDPVSEATTIDIGQDWFVIAGEYHTGDLVKLSATVAPNPINVNQNYWAISIDSTHIRFATNIKNAYAGTYINLTTTGTGPFIITNYALKITLQQQTSVPNTVIGKSDGISFWQKFAIPDTNLLPETLRVSVDGDYDPVETMIYSTETDRHYRIYFNFDGSSYIMFGGSSGGLLQMGKIPASLDVVASWSFGGGKGSNVYGNNSVNIYTGGSQNVIDTSNITDMDGGEDIEDYETARVLAPQLLKAQNVAIFVDQFKSLSLDFDSSIQYVHVNPNFYGFGSCQVFVMCKNGAFAPVNLKTDLQNHLISRSLFKSADVRVIDHSYQDISVNLTVQKLAGYEILSVRNFVKLAWYLTYSEKSPEVARNKNSTDLIALISNLWSINFYESDLTSIKNMIDKTIYGGYPTASTVSQDIIKNFMAQTVPGYYTSVITSPSFPLTFSDQNFSRVVGVSVTI